MTAKRFVASVDESCIVDNLDNKGLYSVVDTVECLNNLHEENEQLKKALVELKEIGDYQYRRIKELSDENTQLKEELQQYKDKHEKWIKECEELHKNFEKDWKRWGRM